MDLIKARAKVIFSQNMNANDIYDIQWTKEGDKEIFCNNRFYGESFSIPEGEEQGEWAEDKNKQGADDYTSIALNRCRFCKKIIKPYTTNYFEKIRDNHDWYKLYCFENGYCEECAKKKAAIVHEPYRQSELEKNIVKKEWRMIGGSYYEEVVYANGNVSFNLDSQYERFKNIDDQF